MPDKRPGRPRGSRNRKPTRSEINDYLALLRTAAQGGDIRAASALVQIHAAEQMTLALNQPEE